MTEHDLQSAGSDVATQPFKDRRVGLIVFGVLELLIAVALLGLVALQLLVLTNANRFAPGMEGVSTASVVVSAVMYSALAAVAAVLGVGSIRCRRWARALNLVLSSIGLATGVLASVLMVVFLPGLLRGMERQMGGSQEGVVLVVGCMTVSVAFVYLIIPAAFVVFYRSRHVRATCEYYDPKARWTDSCPLPVLAGSLLLAYWGVVVFGPFMGVGIPFFGRVVHGAGALLIAIVLGAAGVVLAWGFYRLQRWAWLGVLAFMAVNGLNALITFRGRSLLDLYERMEIPAEQLEMMTEMGITRFMMPVTAVLFLVTFGFYFWLGRYFPRDT
ncbi:MAG: hypothetical protein GY769_18190 [bacterium]|nr:hypothetical protein [bacterium]